MAYVLNNIRFRSVSAKALERYFNAKAFILNELTDERKQFSRVAREILLLTFNNYSGWVLNVESLMLNSPEITEEDLKLIFERQDELIAANRDICNVHDTVFTPEFVKLWMAIHHHVLITFRARAQESIGMTHMEAFPLVIDALVGGLQSTLFELYELDCLLGSSLVETPISTNSSHLDHLITYVSREDLLYHNATGKFPLAERLNVYFNEVIKAGVQLPIIVKNYTEENVALKNGMVVGEQPLARLLSELVANPRVKIVEIVH